VELVVWHALTLEELEANELALIDTVGDVEALCVFDTVTEGVLVWQAVLLAVEDEVVEAVRLMEPVGVDDDDIDGEDVEDSEAVLLGRASDIEGDEEDDTDEESNDDQPEKDGIEEEDSESKR
jgi:hypothetical protein